MDYKGFERIAGEIVNDIIEEENMHYNQITKDWEQEFLDKYDIENDIKYDIEYGVML